MSNLASLSTMNLTAIQEVKAYLMEQGTNYSLPYDARKVAREALELLGYPLHDPTQITEEAFEKYVGNYIKVTLDPSTDSYRDLIFDSLGPNPSEQFPELIFSSPCYNVLHNSIYGVLLIVDACYRIKGKWIRHELTVPESWCEIRNVNFKRV